VSRDEVHEALRIASVVHAVAVTLEAEEAIAAEAVQAGAVQAAVG
jgi:hypothetical protein